MLPPPHQEPEERCPKASGSWGKPSGGGKEEKGSWGRHAPHKGWADSLFLKVQVNRDARRGQEEGECDPKQLAFGLLRSGWVVKGVHSKPRPKHLSPYTVWGNTAPIPSLMDSVAPPCLMTTATTQFAAAGQDLDMTDSLTPGEGAVCETRVGAGGKALTLGSSRR